MLGLGIDGVCAVVGVLALGQPAKATQLATTITAANRFTARFAVRKVRRYAIAPSFAVVVTLTALLVTRAKSSEQSILSVIPGMHSPALLYLLYLPLPNVIGPPKPFCPDRHTIAEARSEQTLFDSTDDVIGLFIVTSVRVQTLKVDHSSSLCDPELNEQVAGFPFGSLGKPSYAVNVGQWSWFCKRLISPHFGSVGDFKFPE